MPRVVVKALSRGQQQPTKRFNNAAARFVLTAFLVLQAAKNYSNVSIEQMGVALLLSQRQSALFSASMFKASLILPVNF
jgi:hypothetical protein